MSDLAQVEAAVLRRRLLEQEELRDWLENLLEERLEMTDAFKDEIAAGKAEIAAGRVRVRHTVSASGSGAATHVYSRQFDHRFLALPLAPAACAEKVDEPGRTAEQLPSLPHGRRGHPIGLRVGDYRVIYQFDPGRNERFLIAFGHRREIYKSPESSAGIEDAPRDSGSSGSYSERL